jgi:hypothetical protein
MSRRNELHQEASTPFEKRRRAGTRPRGFWDDQGPLRRARRSIGTIGAALCVNNAPIQVSNSFCREPKPVH